MQTNSESHVLSSKENHVPKVSVGMPVYNGSKYIREALDSLLSQTFTDFEVIISDNASTDETEALCREYATKDRRIRYIRQPTNIGAGDNFRYVLDLARSIYFKWLAHDDYLEPLFLEKTVNYLDDHDDVVLCMSDVRLVNDNRQVLVVKHLNTIRDCNDWASARRKFFTFSHNLFETIYGMYRLNVLHICYIDRQTRFKSLSIGGEFYTITKIALHGRIVALPEVLSNRRILNDSIARSQMKSISPLIFTLNNIHIIKFQARVALSSKLPFRQKLLIYVEMFAYHTPVIVYRLLEFIPTRYPQSWFSTRCIVPFLNRLRAIIGS